MTEANAGCTSRGFKSSWSLRHPPMMSCQSFVLITHMIQSWISLMAFPKSISTQLEVPEGEHNVYNENVSLIQIYVVKILF